MYDLAGSRWSSGVESAGFIISARADNPEKRLIPANITAPRQIDLTAVISFSLSICSANPLTLMFIVWSRGDGRAAPALLSPSGLTEKYHLPGGVEITCGYSIEIDTARNCGIAVVQSVPLDAVPSATPPFVKQVSN